MEDIFTMVANLGFPIAISIFLLVRIEGRIEKLTFYRFAGTCPKGGFWSVQSRLDVIVW